MNEPIQVPMPGAALPILMKQGGKDKYTLSELAELIDPVYRVYGEQIRRCIFGLTGYAAQCAAARHEEQIPKLRERIVMMGGFWSTEEDTSVDPYEISEQNYGRPFDEAIAEAQTNRRCVSADRTGHAGRPDRAGGAYAGDGQLRGFGQSDCRI